MAPESSQIIAERPRPLQVRITKSACKIPLTPLRKGDFGSPSPPFPVSGWLVVLVHSILATVTAE